MKKIILFVLLGYLYSPLAWTQCWDGTSSNGPVACPPPPNMPGSPVYQDDNSTSPPHTVVWADRWGAIAFDYTTSEMGTAESKNNQITAEQKAMSDCSSHGAQNCKIIVSYKNECVALAASNNRIGFTQSPKQKRAETIAVKQCGDTISCQIIYSACSFPIRIQ